MVNNLPCFCGVRNRVKRSAVRLDCLTKECFEDIHVDPFPFFGVLSFICRSFTHYRPESNESNRAIAISKSNHEIMQKISKFALFHGLAWKWQSLCHLYSTLGDSGSRSSVTMLKKPIEAAQSSSSFWCLHVFQCGCYNFSALKLNYLRRHRMEELICKA